MKAEIDKLLEVRDQALSLYNSMEAERAPFATKEKESMRISSARWVKS